ncbi:MAG: YggS family pyridoxal phosphate-dependent enzyme [Lachnospiraceae bacterium]|nr:YggS family pyridoxal phosphate-dependent enzyme [Lachnospiraceae bacterium]
MIAENLENVRARIAEACQRVGRDPSEVTLIAVSKTKPLSDIEEAMQAGQIDFGENYPQELKLKAEALSGTAAKFHQIGHLQRNKVRAIIDHVVLIHAVDSERLAAQIEAEAAKRDRICDVLIEVNVAGEESKFGVSPKDTLPLILEIAKLPHVHVRGLMTIAPYVEDPESNRIHFQNLHALAVDIKSKNIDNVSMDVLSMGMTGDFEVAVEEGATMVRVGTGIFGARDYTV